MMNQMAGRPAVNPTTFYILPMLGKHPDEYPRFRDCYLDQGGDNIQVLTRTGGGNRESYVEENEVITKMPTYVSDEDCDWDCTYAEWTFTVPEEWKEDFLVITHQKEGHVSEVYLKQVAKVYPKIADKLIEQLKTI